jgi:hypothetical protein
MKSFFICTGIIVLAVCNASAQYPISAGAAANGKIAMRIMENAADADLIDGEFDPFTGGLMDGLQRNLEEDMEARQPGDSRLALMLYNDWLWIVQYRIDHYPEPLRTEIMQWHFDCTHAINVALQRGLVPRHGGGCEFTEAKSNKLKLARSKRLNKDAMCGVLQERYSDDMRKLAVGVDKKVGGNKVRAEFNDRLKKDVAENPNCNLSTIDPIPLD